MDTPTPARLALKRTSPRDLAQREVFVTLDGEELAIMRFGETITRDVAPGRHALRLHNTLFWKTIDLDLAAGEQATFDVINRAGWGTYAIASVLGAGPIYLDVVRL
jgi:hypothetical protein